jgi:hypothetical protein
MNPKLIKYYVAIIYAVSAVIGFVIAYALLPAQTQLMAISSPQPPQPPAPLPQAIELQNLTSKYFGGNWTTINSETGLYVVSNGGFTAYLMNSSTAQLSNNTVKDLTGINYIQTMIQNISNELTNLTGNKFNFTPVFFPFPLEIALNYLQVNSMNVIAEFNGSAVFITYSFSWTENKSPIQSVYDFINSNYYWINPTVSVVVNPILNNTLHTTIQLIYTTVNTTIINNSTVNNITSTTSLRAYYLYIPIPLIKVLSILASFYRAIIGFILLIIIHFLGKSLQKIFNVGILLGMTPNSFSITLVINFAPAVQALVNLVNSAIGIVDTIQS